MTFLSSVPTLLIDSSSRNPFALAASAIVASQFLVRLSNESNFQRGRIVPARFALRNRRALDNWFRQAQYPRVCLRKTYIREILPAAMQQPAPRSGPLEQLADLAHEVPGRERFRDVEVGANRQPLVDLRVTPLCGQHDDLDVPPVGALAYALAHFVAAARRHHHVEQHEVGVALLDQLERLVTVARDAHFVAAALQQELDGRDNVRLVVGDQDFLAQVRAPVGRVNEKRAPLPGLLSTHILPPKCSTIWRLICSPRPLPCGLSVSVSPT